MPDLLVPCLKVQGCSCRLAIVLLLGLSTTAVAQTMAFLQGRVSDASGAWIAGAIVSVRDDSIEFETSVRSDDEGRYYVPALPPGTYTVIVRLPGFRTAIIEQLNVDVGRMLVRDVRLEVGGRNETVLVRAEVPLIDRGTAIGHVVPGLTVQQIPLNGRHFLDLALLGPTSVAPSQTGFSSRPIRGVGALALNSAGNREEAVAFVVNGVTTNNLTFGSLMFDPPLASILEFKTDISPFSAEHGHVSGSVVNIVTRSGSDQIRGDLFEFARNDALDARNFFEFTTPDPHRFQRHQFGGSLGGPILRGRTFFFASLEAFRQRQGVDLNSLVLSDEQRLAVTDPVIAGLLPFIPRANYFDADGTPRFVGSASAIADADRWTLDLRHRFGERDRVEAFYGSQQRRSIEPTSQGNSIPGFGHTSSPFASLLTFNHFRVFDAWLNEARFGRSRLRGGTYPAATLNPVDYGIRNGVTRPLGLPQVIVAGALNFGGPGNLPLGRYDTSYVVSDTFSRASGRHSLRLGGEYRHFINENFAEGTGTFNFPTVEAFLAGTANAYTTTLGERRSVIDQRAVALFAQDHVALHQRLTIVLGVRYEWHVTPTERDDRFVVFDASSASLLRVGVDLERIHRQNNLNIAPRIGIAWDVSPGRTVLRAAFGRAVDEPGTTAVRDTASNPPFGVPLTASGSIGLARAIDAVRPAGLAPATIDPEFRNASTRSWNVNLQRQMTRDLATTVGYMGSQGRHLRITRNLNQPVDGILPFPSLSTSSPILPGTLLGNIMQVESTGYSNYHAVWASVTKRLSHGVHIDASYTWSKSLDTNSLNSSGFAVQDSYDIPNQYGLSDFDARHRFVASAVYRLPFTGHVLTRGWQVSAIVQSQSGNPVNLVTSTSSVNGMPNTVRPDLVGPIRIIGSVDQWFDTSSFVAVNRPGNLGRNVVIGPAFHNTDLSVSRDVHAGGRVALQLRVDVFDLFNHPNFGPPGNVVGTPTFGKISRTRLPTGEAGSSRQMQLAATLTF
jgi:hypothetical protein